ncbi:MAG TPA: MlaE family lipid ABC transporter permease subunit [Tepidisphaeraceae bacterium]|jgi:phospholipid/cholesterol/gamma-HCH transport system permease protein|nr:MlaE family lipid ABC transporter permease subunit [Tepidisphaeraceae bacterium]
MLNQVSVFGNKSLRAIQELGSMAVFAGAMAISALKPPLRLGSFKRELYKIGVLSLIIICISGFAVGMVLGLQGYHTLSRFGAQHSLGAVVGLSLIRELGPVLAALLVIGRAGSAVAAEIASMVATEQLDGLRMLSINPIDFVAAPKAVAMLVVMPLLTALFIVCGLAGGYVTGVGLMKGDPGSYMASLRYAVDFRNDVSVSLIKSIAFGALVSIIATYRGYTSTPTSEGVSAATTSTVVIASVSVLFLDYVITALWGI